MLYDIALICINAENKLMVKRKQLRKIALSWNSLFSLFSILKLNVPAEWEKKNKFFHFSSFNDHITHATSRKMI